MSGCPYKKVYFNWHTGKAEKCTLCYPRIEAGQPTICSETCVGRIRYLGVVLYDSDRVDEAASTPDEKDLLEAQLGLFLDPEDPEVRARALADGVPDDWIEAARRSPVWALASATGSRCRCTPSTAPCPWSGTCRRCRPVMSLIEGPRLDRQPGRRLPGHRRAAHPDPVPGEHAERWRQEPVRLAPQAPGAMRGHVREQNLGGDLDPALARSVGMEAADMEAMYRLLAIARYEALRDPQAHPEAASDLAEHQGSRGPHLTTPRGPAAAGRPCRTDPMGARPFGDGPVRDPARQAAAPEQGVKLAGAISLLLQYPPGETRRSAEEPHRGAAAGRAGSRRRSFAEATAGRGPARGSCSAATRRRSTSTPGRACTSPTTSTATSAGAGRRSSASSAILGVRPAPRGGRGAARLPARRCWSSPILAPEPERACSPSCGSRWGSARPAARAGEPLRRAAGRGVCQLPRLSARQQARIRDLAEVGPPTELVGLEPAPAAAGPRPPGPWGEPRGLFWWSPFPCMAIAIFVVGHIWRYRRDHSAGRPGRPSSWSSGCSKWGSLLFHFGVIAVIGGHVLGILVPESWTSAVGIGGAPIT